MAFSKVAILFALATASMVQAGTGWESGPFFVARTGNKGAPYSVKAPGWAAEFHTGAVLLTHQGTSVAIRFQGARPSVTPLPGSKLHGHAHFFLGNRAETWRTGAPVYREIAYRDLYPGIDLVYGGSQGRLKSEFRVAPGADAGAIRLYYAGAKSVTVDAQGALLAATSKGVFREEAPILYQRIAGKTVPVAGAFRVWGNGNVGFEIGAYDHSQALAIDPVIGSSTYLGGSAVDSATAVAVDHSGNVYVAGWTDSSNFPTLNASRGTMGGNVDAFVAKWSGAGVMQYCTYLGGSGADKALGIAVDSAGNAYVTGSTASPNFPTVSPLQVTLAGSQNAFLAKLNASGALVYGTYLGGSGSDSGNAVAVDSSSNATVVGNTTSANFPMHNAYQSTIHGLSDVFVARINTTGSGMLFSTFLGGSGNDYGTSVALDSSDAVYLTGSTTSMNFPVLNAYQSYNNAGQEAFVAKLSSTGSGLVYSTYLGGAGGSMGQTGSGIAVDGSGNAYVTGTTSSANFPVVNALQPSFAGNETDVFVTKVNPAGNGLVYSTFLGGNSVNYGNAIAVDSSGNAWVTGYTASTDFPVVNALQAASGGGYDAFVSEIGASGTALVSSTYLGGSGSDEANAIALDSWGSAYVAGQTLSFNFPVKNATQPANGGSIDAFVTHIAPPSQPMGFLDSTSCTAIAGWAWDTSNPFGSVNVDILNGTTLLATVPASNYRGDLFKAGYGNGDHGFSFTTPSSLDNGSAHTIYARISGTTTNLFGSPQSVTCGPAAISAPPTGNLDEATCSVIAGWAWNPGTPNTPINVDILAGSTLLATVTAGNYRGDLFKAGLGNGDHGFSYTTPVSLDNGRLQTIAVRISQTSIYLNSSPKTMACALP